MDARRKNSDNSSNTPLSKDAIISKQESIIKLLEEQLELLKKLDVTERSLVNNCVNLTNNEVYELIFKTLSKKDYLGTVSYCRSILGVSRSDYYYYYLKTLQDRAIRENDALKVKDIILKAYNYSGYKKGSRSIKMTLEHEFDITYSRKKFKGLCENTA